MIIRLACLFVMISSLLGAAPALNAQQIQRSWGFVETNGTKLYYEAAGSGPPVVLIHGGWLNSQQWDDQMAALSRQYRVIRYDFRGAGRSRLGDSIYAHYEDLAVLLMRLEIESAHLIGLSAGGQIALDFALTYPNAVRSLVIGASPLRGYDLGTEFTEGMRGVTSAGAAEDLQLTHDRMWAFAPFRVAGTMPEVRNRLNGLILHANTWAASRPNAPRPKPIDPPIAGRLAEIKVPVLMVVGEAEMPALIKEAEFVAGGIPGAKLIRVKNAAHFVNLEQPKLYNEIILKWLRGTKAK